VSSLGLRSSSLWQQVDWSRCTLLICSKQNSPNCSSPSTRFSARVSIGIERLRKLMACLLAEIMVTNALAEPCAATTRVLASKLVARQCLRIGGAAPALKPFVADALIINCPSLKRRNVGCNCTCWSGVVEGRDRGNRGNGFATCIKASGGSSTACK